MASGPLHPLLNSRLWDIFSIPLHSLPKVLSVYLKPKLKSLPWPFHPIHLGGVYLFICIRCLFVYLCKASRMHGVHKPWEDKKCIFNHFASIAIALGSWSSLVWDAEVKQAWADKGLGLGGQGRKGLVKAKEYILNSNNRVDLLSSMAPNSADFPPINRLDSLLNLYMLELFSRLCSRLSVL